MATGFGDYAMVPPSMPWLMPILSVLHYHSAREGQLLANSWASGLSKLLVFAAVVRLTRWYSFTMALLDLTAKFPAKKDQYAGDALAGLSHQTR